MVEQGHVIKLNFNPQLGHEQAGYRPAIIINNDTFHKLTKMTLVCPITNSNPKFPTHVELDNRTKTTGVILCEHIKSVDLSARDYKIVEKIPKDLFGEVLDIIIGEIEIEQ